MRAQSAEMTTRVTVLLSTGAIEDRHGVAASAAGDGLELGERDRRAADVELRFARERQVACRTLRARACSERAGRGRMLVTVLQVSTACSITDGSGAGGGRGAEPHQAGQQCQDSCVHLDYLRCGHGVSVRVVGKPGPGVMVESHGAMTATPCTEVATALRADWPLLSNFEVIGRKAVPAGAPDCRLCGAAELRGDRREESIAGAAERRGLAVCRRQPLGRLGRIEDAEHHGLLDARFGSLKRVLVILHVARHRQLEARGVHARDGQQREYQQQQHAHDESRAALCVPGCNRMRHTHTGRHVQVPRELRI